MRKLLDELYKISNFRYFMGFVVLSVLDTALTLNAILLKSGGTELNPLFAQFVDTPVLFATAIIAAKITGIILVLLLLIWINRLHPENAKTADIISMMKTIAPKCVFCFMAIIMSYMSLSYTIAFFV